jgi:iduronate 2-sulfatase
MASPFLPLLVLAPLLTVAHAALPPKPARPNVLLLISDDLRPQIDAAGYSTDGAPVTTPRLKELAAESVVFTRAYVQEALCAPSRNSFLSGRRPDTTQAWQFRDSFREAVNGSEWTALPQLFLQNGWTTVGAGKIYHPHLPPNWDMDKSWDKRMSDGTWDNWMYPSEPACPNGTVGCGIDDASGDPSLFEDAQTTKVALDQLRNVSSLGPFFVAAGYRKPHVQWRVPKRILDAYPPAQEMPLPAIRDFPAGAPAIAFHQPVDDFLEPFSDVAACGGVDKCSPLAHFSDACTRKWRRQYWAAVTYA